MKKNIYKTLSLLLATLFSLGAVACKGDNKQESSSTDNIIETQDTEHYLVRNAESDYKIVVPEDASSTVMMAASELAYFFEEATTVQLPIVKDTGMTYSENDKCISLGKTSILASSGESVGDFAIVGNDGFEIVTKGSNALLCGGSDMGTLYSVYTFLEKQFNYDYFFTDCFAIDRNVFNEKLIDFQLTEKPDIAYRIANYGFVAGNKTNAYRFRCSNYNDMFILVGGEPWHNSIYYVYSDAAKPSVDPDDDPNTLNAHYWYANGSVENPNQLCYTAHGNEIQYQAMLDKATETLKECLKRYPDRNLATLSIQDNGSFCGCDACAAVKEQYGGRNSSVVILFLNEVKTNIDEWFLTEDGAPYARDLQLLFFAYLGTKDAPAIYNERTEQYEAINGIKCVDGVGPFYAPIEGDFTRTFEEDINQDIYQTMQAWNSVSDSLYLWTYSANFKENYFVFYDSVNPMQYNYRFAVQNGAKMIFDQAAHMSESANTSWVILKNYLNHKLAWDSSLSVNSLIEKFFEGYFGEASEEMLKVFNELRLHIEDLRGQEIYGCVMSCYQPMLKTEMWPQSILENFRNGTQAALDNIAYLRDENPERYEDIKYRILCEKLSFSYLLITLYQGEYSAEDLLEMKLEVKDVTNKLGIVHLGEGGTVQTLLKTWGVE